MAGASPRRGGLAVLAAALVWAALCLVLGLQGYAPSVALVPIPRDSYYLAQAGFVVPLLLSQWAVCASVASRVARAFGGRGRWATTAGPIGFALAGPLVVLFLIPDAVTYAVAGFDALGAVVRVTAPLAFVATLALATWAIGVTHEVASGKAMIAALAGVIAQALLGGMLLR